MRQLVLLSRRLNLRINPANYQQDIDQAMTEEVMALKGQSIFLYLLWLKKLMLKVLFRLQKSIYFRGELCWQNRFLQLMRSNSIVNFIQEANDLIEEAYVTIEARTNLLAVVKQRTLLSASQEQQYQALKQFYRQQNEQLNALNARIMAFRYQFYRLSAAKVAVREFSMNFPGTLFSYHIEKEFLRISEASLLGHIRVTEDAGTIYRNLSKSLVADKPMVEKISEQEIAAKKFLTDKKEIIISNINCLHQSVNQNTAVAIEKRCQATINYAKRIECLLLILYKMEVLLRNYLCKYHSKLTKSHAAIEVVTAVENIKSLLNNKKLSLEQLRELPQKVQMLEESRQYYATTIISTHNAFFFKSSRMRRQQELLLNSQIKMAIADLVIPICALRDVYEVVGDEQIHQQITISTRLREQKKLFMQSSFKG